MGPQEIRKHQETKTLHKAPVEQTAEPLQQTMEAPQLAHLQTEEADQLMAWAVAQRGQIAIPKDVVVGTKVEKRLIKPNKVVPVYGKETFQEHRVKALHETLPALYEQAGSQGVTEAASKEIDLALGDRLQQATAPELVLLRKLNQGQKSPNSVDLEELRRDMQAFHLTTGEERVPLEGAFTPEETLVLMTANLCTHLQQRLQSAGQGDTDSAKAAMEGLFHTTNAYANLIVSKVYQAKQGEIQDRQAELQNQSALAQRQHQAELAQRQLEAQAASEARMMAYRSANTIHLRHFLEAKTKTMVGMDDPERALALEKQLVSAMNIQLNHSHLEDQDATQAFDRALESALANCSLYVRAAAIQTEVEALLVGRGLSPMMKSILTHDKHFLDCYFGEEAQGATQDYLTTLVVAIEESKTRAEQRLSDLLPTAQEAQLEAMVAKLAKEMPQLFLSAGQGQMERQLQLLARLHALYLPQMGEKLELHQEAKLAAPQDILLSDMAKEILAAFAPGDAVFQFLPKKGGKAQLEQEILNHLARTKLENSHIDVLISKLAPEERQMFHDALQERERIIKAGAHEKQRALTQAEGEALARAKAEVYLQQYPAAHQQLGKELLGEMDVLERRELVAQIHQSLATTGAMVAPALAEESPLLRQKILGEVLDGKSMKEIERAITFQRKELRRTKRVKDLAVPLQLLAPISKEGATTITDIGQGQYNTATKPELRYVARINDLNIVLFANGLQEPQLFRQFILDKIGGEKLNNLSHKDYEAQVTALATTTAANLRVANEFLMTQSKQYPMVKDNAQTILGNLRPLMVSQSVAKFEKTLATFQKTLDSETKEKQLHAMTQRRKERMDAFSLQYPTLQSQDVRKIFAGETAQVLLCSPGNAPWQEFADARVAKVLPLLQLIDQDYALNLDLTNQLRLHFADKLYSGGLTVPQAKVAFTAYYEELIARTVKKRVFDKKSMEASTRELLERMVKDSEQKTVLQNYFNHLLSGCTMAQILDLEATWKERGDAITAKVLANHTAAMDFVAKAQATDGELARLQTGFCLYLRNRICTVDSQDFAQDLQAQWAQFRLLDSQQVAETQVAKKTMKERMEVLRDVERHRDRSVAMLEQENARRQALFALETGQRSLFHSVVKEPVEGWSDTNLKVLEFALRDSGLSPLASGILGEYLSLNKEFTLKMAQNKILHLPTEKAQVLAQATEKMGQLESSIRAVMEAEGVAVQEELVGKTMVLALSLYGQGSLPGLALLEDGAMDGAVPGQIFATCVARTIQLENRAKTVEDRTELELLSLESLTLDQATFEKSMEKSESRQAITTAVTTMASDLIEKTGWLPAKKQAVLAGWLVYRHWDMMTHGLGAMEDLTTLAESDFANPELVDLLETVSNWDIHKSYLEGGTMASMGSTSLTETEQAQATQQVMNRTSFEEWISANGSTKQREEYSALSRQERQLFAYGLSMPAYLLNIKPTVAGALVKRTTKEPSVSMKTLEDFILTGETTGLEQLDYQRVKEGLVATESIFGIRKATFQSAMAFAKFCIQARKQALPVDTQRLTDSYASRKAAGKDYIAPPCQTVQGLQEYLLKPATGLPAKLAEAVQGFDSNHMIFLVNLLQNRTLLDISAVQGEGAYVSQEQRDSLVVDYANDLPMALLTQSDTMETVEKAFATLVSYQVADGLELEGDLQKAHLVHPQRTTEVDMTLLEEAVQLVEEIHRKAMGIQAMRNAPALIAQSHNEKAIQAYSQFKDHIQTESDFHAFIQTQVQMELLGKSATLDGAESEKLGLFAAYEQLTDGERQLFFKALSGRDVLDVSKENVMKSRFGFAQREYANPEARHRLLDEYTHTGEVVADDQTVQMAFAGLLSTQIADTATAEEMEAQGGAQQMTSSRTTAVDWKLFKRAIQLVRRANRERETREGQFELYAAGGAVHREGDFRFESTFMRRNLHNAGSRVTRFLGRRLAAKTVGRFTGDSGDAVADNVSNILGALVEKRLESATEPEELEEVQTMTKTEQLTRSASFDQVVNQSTEFDVETAASYGNATLGDMITMTEDGKFGLLQDVVNTDLLGSVTDVFDLALDTVGQVKTVVESASNLSTLEQANQAFAEGQVETVVAAQTAREKAVYEQAQAKLHGDLTQSVKQSKARQVDNLVESVGEIVGSVMGSAFLETVPGAKVIGAVINEAAKVINFARAAFDEKKMVDQDLEATQLWQKNQGDLTKKITQIGDRQPKAYDFALAFSGFENMTEYASAKGTDFVQSLLFAASRFNNVANSKILARTILTILKVEQVGEGYSTRNANLVFDRLMGGKNR